MKVRRFALPARQPRATLLRMMLLLTATTALTAAADERPLPQQHDYAVAMKKVASKFQGVEGVVLHVGDSITYANPHGQWARFGKGKTAADQAVLKWMHAGANNETDGWWLCRFDHPAGGRSHTACSGIRADEMLRGGKRKMAPLSKMLDQYKPRMVVLMLGTNDASAGRDLSAYRSDMEKCVEEILQRGAICILSTIPPHHGRKALVESYNQALREIAKTQGLPLIDFEKEILARRPDDWNGTLLGKNDVHPTSRSGDVAPSSPPTKENLRSSGYLLRGWLSVRKIAEVKQTVLD
ncbi:MAG: SGNH/GDSL hydrolase family protein [Planctomycetales bacterium]